MTYVGVVVFAEDVKKTTIKRWLNIVELGNIRMLDSVDKHLATNNNKKWRQNLARHETIRDPRWKHRKAVRKNRRVMQRLRGVVKGRLRTSTRNTQTTNFNNIAHTDNKEHDPKLKAFDDISTGKLKQIVFLKTFEDSTLDLDELVRKKERQ